MKKYLSFLFVLLLLIGAGCLIVRNSMSPAPAAETAELPFSILFLDVGQGDSALVRCGDHAMLIDGGGRESSQKLYAVLKEEGITHLELVIASHPHEDHTGGLDAVFRRCTVNRLLTPTVSGGRARFQSLLRDAGEAGTLVSIPQVGEHFSLGDASVELLGCNTGPTENAASIVAKVRYGEVSFLFTGDMEAEYFDPQWDLSATVLKVSHHGSRDGTDQALLSRVKPDIAVLSVGADNPYSLPHQSALSLLRQSCKTLCRTDLQGDILFTSDGHTLTLTTQHQATSRELFGTDMTSLLPAPKGYVLNTSSGIFHLPTCPSVSAMKEGNKQNSQASREALISEGYRPCGNCKP